LWVHVCGVRVRVRVRVRVCCVQMQAPEAVLLCSPCFLTGSLCLPRATSTHPNPAAVGWRHTRSAEPRFLTCTYEQNRNIGGNYIWQGPTASKEECCNECAIRDM